MSTSPWEGSGPVSLQHRRKPRLRRLRCRNSQLVGGRVDNVISCVTCEFSC